MGFGKHVLSLDAAGEVDRIVEGLRVGVRRTLRRQGAVIGISGGVDSALVFLLCVRAFGPERVCAVMLPEKESDPESRRLAEELARGRGVEPVCEDITGALKGLGCYERRDATIRRVFPEYRPELGYRAKIALPEGLLESGILNVPLLTVVRPDGEEVTAPLARGEFLEIVAASNFKQRVRMSLLYYHAEVRRFAVIGTANRNERDQGFFVKHGDAGVDVNAIAHLYKTQVYQLADYAGVPEAIRRRAPTTDTYSAPTSQQEFFFRLPFDTMDLLWFAQEHGVPLGEVAAGTGLEEAQIRRAFDDFAQKKSSADYLRAAPLGIDGGRAEQTAKATTP